MCRPPPIIRRITSYPRTRAAELSVRYCNGIASLHLPLDLPLDLAQRPARLCALQRLHAEHVTQCLPNDELDHGVRPEPEPLGRKALGSAEGRDYDEIACNQRQSEEAIRRQSTTLTWKRQSRGNQEAINDTHLEEAIKRQSGGNQRHSLGRGRVDLACARWRSCSRTSPSTCLMRKAIRCHQRSSEVIRCHQRSSEVIRGHQRSSEVIRDHQRSSEVIRGHQRSSEE